MDVLAILSLSRIKNNRDLFDLTFIKRQGDALQKQKAFCAIW